jgi:hypothetical protein
MNKTRRRRQRRATQRSRLALTLAGEIVGPGLVRYAYQERVWWRFYVGCGCSRRGIDGSRREGWSRPFTAERAARAAQARAFGGSPREPSPTRMAHIALCHELQIGIQ